MESTIRKLVGLLGILSVLYSCSSQVEVPRQYKPYYQEQGRLQAQMDLRCRSLRLPWNIGQEILPSYMHNNLLNLSEWDTLGVDETDGIFKFTIAADGKVESVEMISGNIPEKLVENLIHQFRKMRFEPYKRATVWYLPMQIEIAYGKEIDPNGFVFEGKPGYLTWHCFNPRNKAWKYEFRRSP